jgi:hypothetical protein
MAALYCSVLLCTALTQRTAVRFAVRFAVQVVRTTVEPLGGKHAGTHYDAYEYLANHHSYKRDEHPTVKITYNLSPLQVCIPNKG